MCIRDSLVPAPVVVEELLVIAPPPAPHHRAATRRVQDGLFRSPAPSVSSVAVRVQLASRVLRARLFRHP
eukprot:6524596-Alexandrium_andersonii.AAC.1